jgi:hypothetical protein
MVGQLVRSFVDATPWGEEPGEYVRRELVLQAQLGRILGVTPSAEDIIELITSFEELESVESGTHPELAVNLTLTINNAPQLAEYLYARIERETTALLFNAGFARIAVAA